MILCCSHLSCEPSMNVPRPKFQATALVHCLLLSPKNRRESLLVFLKRPSSAHFCHVWIRPASCQIIHISTVPPPPLPPPPPAPGRFWRHFLSYGQTDATNQNIVVGSCCVCVGCCVQTGATTPNNVGTCSASRRTSHGILILTLS